MTLVDVNVNELLHLLLKEDFQPPHTKETTVSYHFKAYCLLINITKTGREAVTVAPAQHTSNRCNDGIIFLFKSKHFKALPGQISSSPTSNFLLALGLLLLTYEAAACSSSSLLLDSFFFVFLVLQQHHDKLLESQNARCGVDQWAQPWICGGVRGSEEKFWGQTTENLRRQGRGWEASSVHTRKLIYLV